MAKTKEIIIGFLTFLILSSVMYVTFQDKARLRVDEDKTTFYVPHGDYSWIWTVSGREYNRIFNGSTLQYRDKSSIKLEYKNSSIERYTSYQNGCVIKDTYLFDAYSDNVENFPVEHRIDIYNCSGYFYRYSVDDLSDTGDKRKLDGLEYSFGKNMKVSLHPGYRWAWIGYPYGGDSIAAQYDIESDNETFYFRLYDPPTLNSFTNTAPRVENISSISDDGKNSTWEDWTGSYDTFDFDYDVVYNFSWYNTSDKSLVLGMPFREYPRTSLYEVNSLSNTLNGKTFNDGTLSGYSFNHGELNGPVLTEGYYGKGYDFDGDNDYITTSDISVANFSLSDSFTYCFWKKSSEDSSKQGFISKRYAPYFYAESTPTINFQLYNGSSSSTLQISSSYGVADNVWQHYCGVYNTTHQLAYLNGELKRTTAVNITGDITNAYPLEIGRLSSSSNYLNSNIDEVRIYNIALTESQIQAEMNSRYPVKTAGLVSSYSFESYNSTHTYDTNHIVSGEFDKGIRFDGVDDTLTTTSQINFTETHTISFWYKTDNEIPQYPEDGDIQQHFIGAGSFVNIGAFLYRDRYCPNGIRARIKNRAICFNDDGNGLSVGEWYYITYVTDSNLNYHWGYVNGELQQNWTMLENATELFNFDVQAVFNGSIDEIRIWEAVLTESEIETEMMSAYPIKTEGLVASYNFEQTNLTGTPDTNQMSAYSEADNETPILHFDGVDDYIAISSFATPQSQTLLIDVKPNPAPSTLEYIFNHRVGNATFAFRGLTLSYSPSYSGGSFYLQRNNETNAVDVWSTKNVQPTNNWYQVAATYDSTNGNMSLYVDGVLENSRVDSGDISYVGGNSLYIGGFDASPESPMFISSVKYYNYSMSADQIYEEYIGSNILKSSETEEGEVWSFSTVSSDYLDYSEINTTSFTIEDYNLTTGYCSPFSSASDLYWTVNSSNFTINFTEDTFTSYGGLPQNTSSCVFNMSLGETGFNVNLTAYSNISTDYLDLQCREVSNITSTTQTVISAWSGVETLINCTLNWLAMPFNFSDYNFSITWGVD